jgi:DNA-binding NarL/FixJ family response regulator
MIGRSRPRVVIADDHTLIAEACAQILEPEFEVIAIVSNGPALIDSVCRLNPDVALVDVFMPLLNGLDAVEQIRNMRRTVKIVFLTMNGDGEVAAEAFRRGASGFLPKTAAASELPAAVRAVLQGERYISPLIAGSVFDLKLEYEGTSGLPGPLTTRQRQVAQLLAEGKSMKEVAWDLKLATRTIAFHKYRIMEILHLKNGAELVQYAIKEHMVSAENSFDLEIQHATGEANCYADGKLAGVS